MSVRREDSKAQRKREKDERLRVAKERREGARPPRPSESVLVKGARGNRHMRRRVSHFWGKYPDSDIFVCGTGTSLSGFDWTRLNGKITIGLNDALKVPGFAPAFSIFSDVGIWNRYRDLTLDERTQVVCQGRSRDQFVRYERCTFKEQIWHFNQQAVARGCKQKSDDLFCARTVACAGIMMAYKLGARRIFLLGVDGYKVAGPKGGTYYHDGSGKGPERRKEKGVAGTSQVVQDRHGWWSDNMKELRDWFDKLGVYQQRFRAGRVFGSNVFNLSALSTITQWEKVKVKSILGGGCFDKKNASIRHAKV